MAEVAGTLVDTLLRRVRDVQGGTHSRDFARSILSQAQRMVNAQIRAVTVTEALATNRRRLFYPINALLPNAIRIEAVKVGEKNLTRTDWRVLASHDKQWFRSISDEIQSFSIIGRDLLVLYPALDSDSSVDVVYTKLTDDLVNEGEPTDLADTDLPAVLELASAILLIRARQFDALQSTLDRFTSKVLELTAKNV